ncbi:uncharacterized protein LOC62_06G008733 [Vanrija pseudolonga]|uniref:Uncharacterized protein n=1 Tax=Vanrija pseudolonga TaxID=143232 RepID=A0AAF0YEH1_9TREE|nr:hypothetical protein LOC62_06G008733 [Vanrija pseudolonga]
MALRDKGLYTLRLLPAAQNPAVLEVVEGGAIAGAGPSSTGGGEARFARVREGREGEVYSSVLYDAYSGAKLASSGFVSDKLKSRRLELHGPDENIPFENRAKISSVVSFATRRKGTDCRNGRLHSRGELDNKYMWKKDGFGSGIGKDMICSLDRRPDPPVEVCLGRRPDANGGGQVQFLHYNIDRFLGHEIKDLRGLETLFVASLLNLFDVSSLDEAPLAGPVPAQKPAPAPGKPAAGGVLRRKSPPLAPQVDYEPEEPNEVIVGTNTDVALHAQRAIGLLQDPNVLFIIIRSKKAAAAQRALQVALDVKRFRHREGLGDLHQYVVEEEDPHPLPPVPKPPRVINLDDNSPLREEPKWTPPPNLAVYLSTIELPDLKPGRRESQKNPQGNSNSNQGRDSKMQPPPQRFNNHNQRPPPSHPPGRPNADNIMRVPSPNSAAAWGPPPGRPPPGAPPIIPGSRPPPPVPPHPGHNGHEMFLDRPTASGSSSQPGNRLSFFRPTWGPR